MATTWKSLPGASGTGAEPPEGALLHFALRTSDVDGAYDRALAAGARSQIEPKDVTLAGDPPVPVRLAFIGGWTARSSSSSRTTHCNSIKEPISPDSCAVCTRLKVYRVTPVLR